MNIVDALKKVSIKGLVLVAIGAAIVVQVALHGASGPLDKGAQFLQFIGSCFK